MSAQRPTRTSNVTQCGGGGGGDSDGDDGDGDGDDIGDGNPQRAHYVCTSMLLMTVLTVCSMMMEMVRMMVSCITRLHLYPIDLLHYSYPSLFIAAAGRGMRIGGTQFHLFAPWSLLCNDGITALPHPCITVLLRVPSMWPGACAVGGSL